MSPLRLRIAWAIAFLVVIPCFAAQQAKPITLKIGIVDTLMRDQPKTLVKAFVEPFRAVVRNQTGFDSTVVPGESMDKLRQGLADGTYDLAVFQGIEYAWQHAKDNKLKPLAIGVNQSRDLRAYLMVPAESKATCFRDLDGKTSGLPRHSREHCFVFADTACQRCGKKDAATFFSEWKRFPNAEDALDDIVDGKLESLVVDGVALECYKRRKPKRYEKLKPLVKSESFPANVIAYRDGTKIDDKTLARFRAGLLEAHKSIVSRNLMSLWHLTAFENVPDDYHAVVKSIVESYPPPK